MTTSMSTVNGASDYDLTVAEDWGAFQMTAVGTEVKVPTRQLWKTLAVEAVTAEQVAGPEFGQHQAKGQRGSAVLSPKVKHQYKANDGSSGDSGAYSKYALGSS
eukprot:gene25437-biopygen10613